MCKRCTGYRVHLVDGKPVLCNNYLRHHRWDATAKRETFLKHQTNSIMVLNDRRNTGKSTFFGQSIYVIISSFDTL